ncbi:MAG: JAB domain-containing protein, partial [Chlorobium sp.]
ATASRIKKHPPWDGLKICQFAFLHKGRSLPRGTLCSSLPPLHKKFAWHGEALVPPGNGLKAILLNQALTAMQHSSHTLPLFTSEAATVTIPRYGIRLVRESQIIYTKGINGAEMVVGLCKTIGLQERASEELHVFYLNTKNDVIGMELVSKGTLNASLVHPREVFKGALLANANSIMVVHNHPSGNPEPSRADRDVTTKLIEAGNILDINLLDHIIIGNNQHFSFFSHGLIPK